MNGIARTPQHTARVAILGLALAAACSAQADPSHNGPTPTLTPISAPAAIPSAAASAMPTLDPSLTVVPATANIFGAGHVILPAPGGGGSGTEPIVIQLPAGTGRSVTISHADGTVIPIGDLGLANGADGAGYGITNIESHGGISGIRHDGNTMFLVGVFLTDAEPADPAPERLEFADGEDFVTLEPVIAQVFPIGNGDGRTFVVPDEATRLFLGFADAAAFVGRPGYYGNNTGAIGVRVEVDADG